jgi:hypothetical protein
LPALQARVAEAKAAVTVAAAGAEKVPEVEPPAKRAGGAAKKGHAAGAVPSSFAGVVVDDEQARKVGGWRVTRVTPGFIGDGYVNDLNTGKGEKTITFQPELPAAGRYEVRLAYTAGGNRATNVPVTVFSADGEKTVQVNQQVPPPIDGHFVSLGQHLFERNGAGSCSSATRGRTGTCWPTRCSSSRSSRWWRRGRVSQRGQAGDEAAAKSEAPLAAGQRPARPAALRHRCRTRSPVRTLEAELKQLQASGPKRETALSVVEEAAIEDAAVHVRGSVHNLGPVVPRGFLSAVAVAGRARRRRRTRAAAGSSACGWPPGTTRCRPA